MRGFKCHLGRILMTADRVGQVTATDRSFYIVNIRPGPEKKHYRQVTDIKRWPLRQVWLY